MSTSLNTRTVLYNMGNSESQMFLIRFILTVKGVRWCAKKLDCFNQYSIFTGFLKLKISEMQSIMVLGITFSFIVRIFFVLKTSSKSDWILLYEYSVYYAYCAEVSLDLRGRRAAIVSACARRQCAIEQRLNAEV